MCISSDNTDIETTDVFEIVIDGHAGGANFANVFPVHKQIMQGIVYGIVLGVAHKGRQELCELGRCHLARRHCKFVMLDFAHGADALDLYIIWRVGQNHLGAFVAHNRGVGFSHQRIATDDCVPPKPPDVAAVATPVFIGECRNRIRFRVAGAIVIQNQVDFGGLKTGDFQIEIQVQVAQFVELQVQQLDTPFA